MPNHHKVRPYLSAILLCASMAFATGCAPQRVAPQTPPSSPLDQLAWMTGRWISNGEDGTITEEYWMPPRGGTMLGIRLVNVTMLAPLLWASWRRRNERWFRLPAPAVLLAAFAVGVLPWLVWMAWPEAAAVVRAIENPQHDFPRTIDYWRDGDLLHGRIEGVEKGDQRSEQWTWRLIR